MNQTETPAEVGCNEGLGGCALRQLRELVVFWQYDKDCPAKVVAEINRMLAAAQPAEREREAFEAAYAQELLKSHHDRRRTFRRLASKPDEYEVACVDAAWVMWQVACSIKPLNAEIQQSAEAQPEGFGCNARLGLSDGEAN